MVVSKKFYIGYRDVDCNFKMKNSSILGLFQEIAGIHANKCGEGNKDSNTAWVLTAYKVSIMKRPVYGETIDVITWGREIKGFTAVREFELRNETGELLVCAISNWAHIDIAERKLTKVTPELIEGYGLEPDHKNFEEMKIKKLEEPENYSNEREFYIDWNWLDVNMHMNNVHYVEIAEMMLPEEIKVKNDYSGIEIMYKKEIKYKEKIKCMYAETKDEYIVTIKNEDLSELHAIIKLTK